jgi:acetyl-CoA carboxylase/biotin carboxylase 1
MEAKGCAKSAEWKTARRFFYWALRARVARSAALEALAEANPDTTYEHRFRLLTSLIGIVPPANYEEEAAALEKLDLTAAVAQLKADHLARRLVDLAKEDRKTVLDGFLRFTDDLSDDERATVINALQQNASRSPGLSLPLIHCNLQQTD